jgi:3-oxoacyl-(acyl-carrier-protein) synthase
MSKRVVITGIGAVTAAGLGAAALWDGLEKGQPLLTEIDRFGLPSGPMKAGQVPGFRAREWMPAALIRQTDLSTQFAIAAVRMSLEDAGIAIEHVDPLQIGIMAGHAIGGMTFAEPQMYSQKFFGPGGVSTYQAIAWFYAAPLGQLSMALKVKGYSKSFVADRASSVHAIGHGFRTIQEGRLDICLAGGTEAPLVPYVYQAMEASGRLARDQYLPFSSKASGFLLGEGACFLVLEERSRALARGARIYAEIKGFGLATDPSVGSYKLSGADDLGRAMQLAIAERDGPIEEVFADGAALPEDDAIEVQALRSVIKEGWDGCMVTVPKAVVGELYGAGGAVQAAGAVLSIHHQQSLPLVTNGSGAIGLPYTSSAKPCQIRHVLINSRANGGMNSSLVIGANNEGGLL